MGYIVDTETTKVHRLTMSGADLIGVLNGGSIRDACRNVVIIPRHAEVSFQVPGGGDWSNTRIEVDEDCPIVVTWKEGT